jgi:hypothetical protein
MHPSTDQFIAELEKIPAFRAQKIAAEHAKVDVRTQISHGLYEAERVLTKLATMYFVKNPHLDRAPYAFFLVYNVETRKHDINVQVGNEGIAVTSRTAFARIVTGTVERAGRHLRRRK